MERSTDDDLFRARRGRLVSPSIGTIEAWAVASGLDTLALCSPHLVSLWQIEENQLRGVQALPLRATAACFSEGSEVLVLATPDGLRVARRQPGGFEVADAVISVQGRVASIFCLPGGRCAVASDSGVWGIDLSTGKASRLCADPAVAVVAAGEDELIVGFEGGEVRRLDPTSGERLGSAALDGTIHAIAVAAGDHRVAVVGTNGAGDERVRLLELPTLSPASSFDLSGASAAICRRKGLLAVGDARGRVRVLRLSSGREAELTQAHGEAPVEFLAFDPSGRRWLSIAPTDGGVLVSEGFYKNRIDHAFPATGRIAVEPTGGRVLIEQGLAFEDGLQCPARRPEGGAVRLSFANGAGFIGDCPLTCEVGVACFGWLQNGLAWCLDREGVLGVASLFPREYQPRVSCSVDAVAVSPWPRGRLVVGLESGAIHEIVAPGDGGGAEQVQAVQLLAERDGRWRQLALLDEEVLGQDAEGGWWRVSGGALTEIEAPSGLDVQAEILAVHGAGMVLLSHEDRAWVWRVNDGGLTRIVLAGDGTVVTAAAIAPDGEEVAVATGASVHLWREGSTLAIHREEGVVRGLAYTPEGGGLWVGVEDRGLSLHHRCEILEGRA